MRKNLLILMMTFIVALPTMALPMFLERGIAEQIDDQVTLAVDGNSVTVSGAQGLVLEVVSLTGKQVAQYRIDAPVQRVELNLAKGCYVLKVGKVVRKISVR